MGLQKKKGGSWSGLISWRESDDGTDKEKKNYWADIHQNSEPLILWSSLPTHQPQKGEQKRESILAFLDSP